MWSARARWKVHSGALDAAVVLVQGSHSDWGDVEGDEQLKERERMVLRQADQPAPCEITIDFPETSFFVSLIQLSSTARTCEVYSRKLGSQDHEYVCTVRGKEQKTPTNTPAFPTPRESSRQKPPPNAPAFPTPPEPNLQDSPLSPPAISTPPETSHQEPPPNAPASPVPPERGHQSLSESRNGQLSGASGPDSKSHVLPSEEKSLDDLLFFYTCGVKLARGPALTSLRLKFVSLQNKAELQMDPIRVYASRGPTAAAPPRLTGNSLSALAPLLPALGPLFSSGVPGIPQLPGAFSHLLPPQQGGNRPEPRSLGRSNCEETSSSPTRGETGSVNKGAASGGHSHLAVPEGLAQLMASMQGLKVGRGNSHSAGAAHLDSAGVGMQRPPMNLAALMAAIGNSRGGLPGGVTPRSSDQEAVSNNTVLPGTEKGKDTQSVAGMKIGSEATQRREDVSCGAAEQEAALKAILRRLEGLEGTCLRIEKAVAGALNGFDARLRRLEEQDIARGGSVNGAEGVSGRRHRAEASGVNGHEGIGERRAAGGVSDARERFADREDPGMTEASLPERRNSGDRPGGVDGQANEGASEATKFEGAETETVRRARHFASGAGQAVEGEGLEKASLKGPTAASEQGGKRIPPETGPDAPETVPYEEAEAAAVL